MLADLKLCILLRLCIWRKHIEIKTITRWYYSYFPKRAVKAFTLAEILITLLIIGVVASITIPGLIAETQEQELKVAWKKSFAEISQAMSRLVTDNGEGVKNKCSTDNSNCFSNLFAPYLSHTVKCYDDANPKYCWHRDNQWKYLNGIYRLHGTDTEAGFILNNGALFLIWGVYPNCNEQVIIENKTNTIHSCADVFVDVNGFKGPNTIGKDIYLLHVLEKSIKPFGANDDGYQNTCTSITRGYSCSSEYLYQ